MADIAPKLLAWHQKFGRKHLPWQQSKTLYSVWISEIMLQQTQVTTVIPYFQRFMQQFSTLKHLAKANEDEVLALWSGLGYYSRARNLHKTAVICHEKYDNNLPENIEELTALPGIGRSTAGAILSLACNQVHPILDGNVKRVLARFYGIKEILSSAKLIKQLWHLAEINTPKNQTADYTQAIMDLGATVCIRSKPKCDDCPIKESCSAKIQSIQHELPAKKTKIEKPTRSTTMLIICNEHNEILLQKRPPLGVWAKLWSFPEAQDAADIKKIEYKYQAQPKFTQELPPLTHVFSHFKLNITPKLVKGKSQIFNSIQQPADSLKWLHPNEIHTLGIPKPVKTLTQYLLDNNLI